MNKLTPTIVILTLFSHLLYGQELDSNMVPIPYWLPKPEKPKKADDEYINVGNRLYFIYKGDTLMRYLAINRKIIKSNNSVYYLEWNGGEQIIEEKNNQKTVYTSPIDCFYGSFGDIPKSWDIDTCFWSLQNVGLRGGGGGPFCTGADGYLKRIPLTFIDAWTGNLFIKKVPKYGIFDASSILPMHRVFYEKYFVQQLENHKKGKNCITYIEVRNAVAKETFFDLLITSKNEVLYILYHDKKLMIWQLNETTKLWEKKNSFTFNTTGFFTCFEYQNALYLIDYQGFIFKINRKSIKKIKSIPEKLIDITLVINKDNGLIGYVKQSEITNAPLVSKIINEKTINLFSERGPLSINGKKP
jgi:hypothetical protein